MVNYLESEHVLEEKKDIVGIPSIVFRPKDVEGLLPTIIHYHGWTSNKERQRIRGFILASLGYQVILPDSINHGERNPLDDYGTENAIKLFWSTVFQNLEEADEFIDDLILNHMADPDRIGIIGHSMGAITGLGVFVQNPRIKTLVAFNGTGAWLNFNSILKDNLLKGIENEGIKDDIKEVELRLKEVDPINKLDKIKDRPMLLLHGIEDDVVPIESQEDFHEAARKAYKNKRNIQFIKYQNTKHLVTTNMLEDSIRWFTKHM